MNSDFECHVKTTGETTMSIIINGRRINPNSLPQAGIYGKRILDEVQAGSGRRTVLQRGYNGVETISPDKIYKPGDLIDKHGQGLKVTSMPDRSKGSFEGNRSVLSKRIITEQVYDLATHLFRQGLDFDEESANWMVVPKYTLPPNWHYIARHTPLMVVLPTEYPERPPIGFYMMADIPCSPNGHFIDFAAHDAWQEPMQHGWKWYCVYIKEGAWNPSGYRQTGDWKRGDNLFTYFTLISEVLSGSTD